MNAMTFGEAKFIRLALKQIKSRKSIPKLMNDLDLDEQNVKVWTIDNVGKYFESKGMNEISKELVKEKVNGFVLVNLNESDVVNLKFKNVSDINFFMTSIKLIQSKQNFDPDNNNEQDFDQQMNSSSSQPPEIIICPLTKKVMRDPVTAQDGFTYERRAIEKRLDVSLVSPMTGVEMASKTLVTSASIRKMCDDWFEQHPEY
eukprot:c19657_g1_i1.p1 GENE.c19657_g1_i1~~c19657_g1_i1.p1  ORF type:complete len:202 (+),score=102.55 c19657_g1_i1:142-747(+)